MAEAREEGRRLEIPMWEWRSIVLNGAIYRSAGIRCDPWAVRSVDVLHGAGRRLVDKKRRAAAVNNRATTDSSRK